MCFFFFDVLKEIFYTWGSWKLYCVMFGFLYCNTLRQTFLLLQPNWYTGLNIFMRFTYTHILVKWATAIWCIGEDTTVSMLQSHQTSSQFSRPWEFSSRQMGPFQWPHKFGRIKSWLTSTKVTKILNKLSFFCDWKGNQWHYTFLFTENKSNWLQNK